MADKSSGCSFTSLCITVFLIFLVLKLTGAGQVAQWSWWWVTSPIWICLICGGDSADNSN